MIKISTLNFAIWIILIGIALIISLPFLLPKTELVTWFKDSGTIGDTIGGITAPIVNLMGAILVFLALKAQIDANEQVKLQLERDAETESINHLYNFLNERIENFRFTTLPFELKGIIQDTTTEVVGGEAFHKLFSQIRCNYHDNESLLFGTQSVSELFSILQIVDNLLSRLVDSKSRNKEIVFTLLKHQFEYRITTRIREDTIDKLGILYCETCACNHGLPTELLLIIKKIREGIEKFEIANNQPIHNTQKKANKPIFELPARSNGDDF